MSARAPTRIGALGGRWKRLRSSLVRRLWPAVAGINDYERRVYSQNGEDGIVDELFRRLGTSGGRFVEFGVGDGSECNTALLARERGWSGWMLENDPDACQRLAAAYAPFSRVRTACRNLTVENIDSTLAELGVPREFDLLSIDVDGNDYWLWRAAGRYQPHVVGIEYNAAYPPPVRCVMAYNPDHVWNGTTYHGASIASVASLRARLDYALVGALA